MARQNRKYYDFQCQSCKHEFKTGMWCTDHDYNGTWVPEGAKCPSCEVLCFPENFQPPKTDNSVTDKDVRTGAWVNKLPDEWKYMQNKIKNQNKSSITTMETL